MYYLFNRTIHHKQKVIIRWPFFPKKNLLHFTYKYFIGPLLIMVSEDLVAQEDGGYNRIKSQLPIGEITVYQYTDFKTPDSKGTLSIGPLKCWGNSKQKFVHIRD